MSSKCLQNEWTIIEELITLSSISNSSRFPVTILHFICVNIPLLFYFTCVSFSSGNWTFEHSRILGSDDINSSLNPLLRSWICTTFLILVFYLAMFRYAEGHNFIFTYIKLRQVIRELLTDLLEYLLYVT